MGFDQKLSKDFMFRKGYTYCRIDDDDKGYGDNIKAMTLMEMMTMMKMMMMMIEDCLCIEGSLTCLPSAPAITSITSLAITSSQDLKVTK